MEGIIDGEEGSESVSGQKEGDKVGGGEWGVKEGEVGQSGNRGHRGIWCGIDRGRNMCNDRSI